MFSFYPLYKESVIPGNRNLNQLFGDNNSLLVFLIEELKVTTKKRGMVEYKQPNIILRGNT
ncbi:hypothetical protein C1634_006800 [Chryseobacterium viscerum]|uniref:Uncharacterized protein n=1 Tax=Chryseobacterium viscerum TaxID=1037377 RepID=A0A316WM82_9FLAO|nr:hypothetical protein C1634_006800 [Chryseobacterium viscerum]